MCVYSAVVCKMRPSHTPHALPLQLPCPGPNDCAPALPPPPGTERVLWVTNQDDSTGSARTFGGSAKLSLVLTATQVLTWLVDLAAVPSKRTGGWGALQGLSLRSVSPYAP